MFNKLRRWFFETPDRALDQAYNAALKIRAIENEHFNGEKVSPDNSEYGESVCSFFQTEVENNLKIAKNRLAEFQASLSVTNFYDGKKKYIKSGGQYYDLEPKDQSAIVIEKLDFIDQVLNRYQDPQKSKNNRALTVVEPDNNQEIQLKKQSFTKLESNKLKKIPKYSTVSDKTGVLPRSIFRTVERIKKEIDPQASETEEEVLKKFRKSRNKTYISIKFLLILIIIPLLTHQVSKTFVVKPAVEAYFAQRGNPVLFINRDLEEEALKELESFEEKIRLKSIIGWGEHLSEEEIEKEVRHEAQEIVSQYQNQGLDAIQNIFADLLSFIAFVLVLIFSQREIAILKSFIDEIIYGLSDSAKAFLIILFTDIFVGYHSPHGWEVILAGVARHFGLPENHEFDYLFIATFPVILDTVLKYWIFRYLNRISPSAVATYRNMNE